MYPRVEYELSEEDHAALLEACQPVPYIVVGGYPPSSPQQNANAAWAALGRKMGFNGGTVQPVVGKSQRFFTAVPLETGAQL